MKFHRNSKLFTKMINQMKLSPADVALRAAEHVHINILTPCINTQIYARTRSLTQQVDSPSHHAAPDIHTHTLTAMLKIRQTRRVTHAQQQFSHEYFSVCVFQTPTSLAYIVQWRRWVSACVLCVARVRNYAITRRLHMCCERRFSTSVWSGRREHDTSITNYWHMLEVVKLCSNDRQIDVWWWVFFCL